MTATFTWVDKDGNKPFNLAPPPPYIYLRETDLAGWSSGDDSVPNFSNGTADDGWNDPLNNESAAGGKYGLHLIWRDTHTGTFTVSRDQSIAVNAERANGAMLPVLLSEFNLEPDNRSAIITSPDLEFLNFYKDSYYGEKTTHTRNSDGSMTIDTVVGQNLITSTSTGDLYRFADQLVARTSGFDWSTNFLGEYSNGRIDWVVDGIDPDPGYARDLGVIAVKNGSVKDLPTTMNVQVKVTDFRDGATAQNTYHINLHKPFENGHEIESLRVFDHDEKFPWSEQVKAGANQVTVSLVKSQAVPSYIQDGAVEAGLWISGVAGSGLTALFLAPEAAIPAIIGDMVCNVVGITLIKFGTPDPAKYTTAVADFSAFEQAVAEDVRIRNGTATDVNTVCRDEYRIISNGDLRPEIAADPALLYKYWLHTANPSAKCHGGVRMLRCTVGGDAYNSQGYKGYHEYKTLAVGPTFLVWQFDMTGQAGP